MKTKFIPTKIYFEKEILDYPLGKRLFSEFSEIGLPMIEIENHNNIPELRELPDKEYIRLKRYLILGVRKSLRLLPNTRSAQLYCSFYILGMLGFLPVLLPCMHLLQEFLSKDICEQTGDDESSTS